MRVSWPNGSAPCLSCPRSPPVKHRMYPEFRPAKNSSPATPPRQVPVQIVNGRFVANGKVLWGGAVNDGWWRGQAIPAIAVDGGGLALTRFVPGRTGPGLTEDLAELAARMVAQGTPFYQSIPGLWYDRRRDEHSIISRPDANVWAPFYEMPWARSGTGTAADGLSLFDLSRFNPWYYERFREFGQLCDRNGLVLYHNLYNTHNTLEIPPHWIDYPWRPANNINDTGLPEPPPIEPGNHIHVANEVYDVTTRSAARFTALSSCMSWMFLANHGICSSTWERNSPDRFRSRSFSRTRWRNGRRTPAARYAFNSPPAKTSRMPSSPIPYARARWP